MITDKVTRILMLFYDLYNGKFINKQEYCMEHGIVERSFERDILDIRLFLNEIYSGNDIVYDRSRKGYHMTHVVSGRLSGEETVAILNLILGTNTLCQKEKMHLLESMLSVTETSRRPLMEKIVVKRLASIDNENIPPLMKLQWDIALCMMQENILQLEYKNQESITEIHEIKLLDIVLRNGELYIKAYPVNEEQGSDFPLFFSLKQIRQFRIIK